MRLVPFCAAIVSVIVISFLSGWALAIDSGFADIRPELKLFELLSQKGVQDTESDLTSFFPKPAPELNLKPSAQVPARKRQGVLRVCVQQGAGTHCLRVTPLLKHEAVRRTLLAFVVNPQSMNGLIEADNWIEIHREDGRLWWRRDRLNFSVSILEEERPRISFGCQFNRLFKLFQRAVDGHGVEYFSVRHNGIERYLSEQELRQLLARYFEWLMEKLFPEVFGFISVSSEYTNLDQYAVSHGKGKGKGEKSKGEVTPALDKKKTEQPSGSTEPKAMKSQQDSSVSEADGSSASEADRLIQKKQYDQAIEKVLEERAKEDLDGVSTDHVESMSQAVSGKLRQLTSMAEKGKTAEAVEKGLHLKLISAELLDDQARQDFKTFLDAFGFLAVDSALAAAKGNPKALRSVYLRYRPLLTNADFKSLFEGLWRTIKPELLKLEGSYVRNPFHAVEVMSPHFPLLLDWLAKGVITGDERKKLEKQILGTLRRAIAELKPEVDRNTFRLISAMLWHFSHIKVDKLLADVSVIQANFEEALMLDSPFVHFSDPVTFHIPGAASVTLSDFHLTTQVDFYLEHGQLLESLGLIAVVISTGSGFFSDSLIQTLSSEVQRAAAPVLYQVLTQEPVKKHPAYLRQMSDILDRVGALMSQEQYFASQRWLNDLPVIIPPAEPLIEEVELYKEEKEVEVSSKGHEKKSVNNPKKRPAKKDDLKGRQKELARQKKLTEKERRWLHNEMAKEFFKQSPPAFSGISASDRIKYAPESSEVEPHLRIPKHDPRTDTGDVESAEHEEPVRVKKKIIPVRPVQRGVDFSQITAKGKQARYSLPSHWKVSESPLWNSGTLTDLQTGNTFTAEALRSFLNRAVQYASGNGAKMQTREQFAEELEWKGLEPRLKEFFYRVATGDLWLPRDYVQTLKTMGLADFIAAILASFG